MPRGRLLDVIDARELIYWRAYERIEPFTNERLNYHFAALSMIILTALGAKRRDERAFELKDLLLEWTSPFEEQEVAQVDQSAKAIEMAILAWVEAANSRIEAKDSTP
jgi:hypothetical protein